MLIYLAGMAVECALKARIARRFKANTLPDKALVNDIYRDGHRIERLLDYAQLRDDRDAEARHSPEFQANWNIVSEWEIDSRYRRWSRQEASDMVEAVTKRGTGVLAWIRRCW